MHIEQSAISQWLSDAAHAARAASDVLARMPGAQRDAGLRAAAAQLRAHCAEIVAANAQDVTAFDAAGGSSAFRDRLLLTPDRVEAMAVGLEEIADQPDPLARVLAEWTRPNGLVMRRVAQPLGVIGMIYESRPNVGADAAGGGAEASAEGGRCVVCLERMYDVVFVGCGHLVLCGTCAAAIDRCPVCRRASAKVKVYRA